MMFTRFFARQSPLPLSLPAVLMIFDAVYARRRKEATEARAILMLRAACRDVRRYDAARQAGHFAAAVLHDSEQAGICRWLPMFTHKSIRNDIPCAKRDRACLSFVRYDASAAVRSAICAPMLSTRYSLRVMRGATIC